jgi:hypothetical protein
MLRNLHISNPTRNEHVGNLSSHTLSNSSSLTDLSSTSNAISLTQHRTEHNSSLLHVIHFISCFDLLNHQLVNWISRKKFSVVFAAPPRKSQHNTSNWATIISFSIPPSLLATSYPTIQRLISRVVGNIVK